MVSAFVTAANLEDREELLGLLDNWKNPKRKMKIIWVDGGYTGDHVKISSAIHGISLEVVKRTDKSFKILPRRWVVERTFAWLGKYRRLSKDYEYCTSTSEAMLYIGMSRTMLKRLRSF